MRVMTTTATAALCALIGVGCGSEEDAVRAANHDLAKAAQDKDAGGVCRLLFSNVFLPPAVARQARVPDGGNPRQTAADYGADQRDCAKGMGRGGEFAVLAKEQKLANIKIRQIKPTGKITALASTNGQVRFVKYRDQWRVLFITN
jgi:hypothetical protein